MKGIFYGVGVGPGDPELMTRKAERILRSCGAVAYPRAGAGRSTVLEIVRAVVPLEDKRLVALGFPMSRDAQVLEQAHIQIVGQVAALLDAGLDVAMPTLGDPSIYSTVSPIARRLGAAGYACRIVPGVPSFCAAAALAGEPLTASDRPLHIIPAARVDNLEQMMALEGGKVFMKARGVAGKLVRLCAGAVLVENAGLPGERVTRGPVVEATGYFSTVLVRDE